MNILVVGAGFAGATVARTLAEAGCKVHVIDKRDHIAGNAHDYIDENGIRVHKYGPHLWHTSNDEVQEWASRFTEWLPYEHWVRALLPDGRSTPLPINDTTIYDVYGKRFEEFCGRNYGWSQEFGCEDRPIVRAGAFEQFIKSIRENHNSVTNSRQHVEASVGKELCDLFFAPYTKKMWGLELDELPANIAARIPTSVGTTDRRYFPNDKHQVLPKDGYTKMFERILDHENISVQLGIYRNEVPLSFDHTFTSEPIDTYFDCRLGALPWRSIRMHVVSLPLPKALPSPVLNFTHDGPYTRVTEWKQLPGHGDNKHSTTLTFEEPCDYQDNNMERYYPVKTAESVCPNRELYKKYVEHAKEFAPYTTFIGRCGLYTYQDMHAVISTSMSIVKKFLQRTT